MRCKQDMIEAGEHLVPRTCPVHGINRCRPKPAIALNVSPSTLIDWAEKSKLPINPDGKKVYLAGKMRGVKNFNKPLFDAGAALLRAKGYFVFSPVESTESIYGPTVYTDNPEGDEPKAGIDGRTVFAADLKFICEHAQIVALLPGWETSKGACAEKAVAEALGIEVLVL